VTPECEEYARHEKIGPMPTLASSLLSARIACDNNGHFTLVADDSLLAGTAYEIMATSEKCDSTICPVPYTIVLAQGNLYLCVSRALRHATETSGKAF